MKDETNNSKFMRNLKGVVFEVALKDHKDKKKPESWEPRIRSEEASKKENMKDPKNGFP